MTFPTREVGTGARMMVGFQPDGALMADPPLDGSVQAITGKATATSPMTGTVVDGAPPTVVEVGLTLVDAVVPRSDVPQPASSAEQATQRTDNFLPVRHRGANGGWSTEGIDVMGQTIGPHAFAPVGNRCGYVGSMPAAGAIS